FPGAIDRTSIACKKTSQRICAARLFALAVLLTLTSHLAHGQAIGGGQIQGIVTDTNGALVPGATVTAKQQESGLTRVVVSGDNGGYNLPNLPVGPYEIDVTKPGFTVYHQSGIVIQV